MHTGAFDMLHYARYQYVFSVGNDINFEFCSHHVFIYKYGILDFGFEYYCHIAFYVFFCIGNYHILSADNI
ncbi:hypothetical protein SDC9_152903 [bioreactor metagenome]|uniref:Uncharacterized protein n=1 Tax=bioreactor metagenome TaxID=1076179 RepID=A0A645EWP9_9ZZZZ